MSSKGNRDEELDTDLCEVEVSFEDDNIGQGDAKLLLDPALVLGDRPAQHVWSCSKLIDDGGRASPHTAILLGWCDIGKLFLVNFLPEDAASWKRASDGAGQGL